ncbi:MAG: CvpA family protein [Planctomycetales bacterium]|nr:CvpA family protein [Planctomycetales bacterium]
MRNRKRRFDSYRFVAPDAKTGIGLGFALEQPMPYNCKGHFGYDGLRVRRSNCKGHVTVETYDILMLIVLAAAGIFGAVKGFAWQLASIASIVLSYFVAYRFREPLSHSIVAEPPWNQFLAMLILFIGTSLVVWVAFNMVRQTIDRMKLKEFDRQIGALFGLLKGGLYCTLITLFAVTLMGTTIREKIVASKSGRFIARNLNRSESVIPPEIHQFLGPYLERFDAEFQQAGSAGNPPIDPAMAGQLIDQTRDSFQTQNLPPVFQSIPAQPAGWRP